MTYERTFSFTQAEKEALAGKSNGITYICPDCKDWLYSDKLSRQLHEKSCPAKNSEGLN